VWIVTQAWQGEILGVFAAEADANRLVATIQAAPNHRPTTVEAHDVQQSEPDGEPEPT